MNFSHLRSSLERVNYIPASPIYKKLIALFQDALDSFGEGAGNLVSERSSQIRRGLTKIDFYDRLKEIVRVETGLKVLNVHVIDSVVPDAAYTLDAKNKAVIDAAVRYRDLPTGQNPTRTVSAAYLRLMEAVTGSLDLDTGKVKIDLHDVIFFSLFYTVGVFDIRLNGRDVAPLTAEELAAITLHEIGHCVSHVENYKQQFFQASLITDTIRYASQQEQLPKEAHLLARILKERLQKLEVDFQNGSPAERLVSQMEEGHAPVAAGNFALAAFMVIGVCSAMFASLINSAMTSIYNAKLGSQKTSDVMITHQNVHHWERSADEFASRHGASAALASALIKGRTSNTAVTGKLDERLRVIQASNIGVESVINAFRIMRAVLPPPLFAMADVYEPHMHRLDRLLQDNMAAFKDPQLPAAIRDKLLDDVDQLRAILQEYKGRIYVKWREAIWSNLFKLDSPRTVIGSFIDGGLSADYKTLMEVCATLIRQPLYEQSARLGRIIDQRG